MKLLERDEIEKITAIRMLRIVDWICSDLSGFRCWNLFLMRKVYIVEVSNDSSLMRLFSLPSTDGDNMPAYYADFRF